MIKTNNKIIIPENDPFQNDKLDRKKLIDNLTNVIRNFDGNFVMSIDSSWGTGKTTFIEMRKKQLDNLGEFKTFYLNSWDNDSSNDPLLELISLMEKEIIEKKKFGKVKDIGKKLAKGIISTTLKIATNSLLDIKGIELGEFTEKEIVDLMGKIGELKYSEHKQIKNIKESFKKALFDYQMKEKKRIIIFIDELDRCRPTYAIETLERIKHLFDIDNYVFIISLDKEQLTHSIKTVYGNNMDSDGYLKRFFDLEYKLPLLNRNQYIDYLIDKYGIKVKHTEYFWEYIKSYILYFKLSLRDIEKLFNYIRLFISSDLSRSYFSRKYFNPNTDWLSIYKYMMGTILSFLIILKFKDSKLFDKLQEGIISNEDINLYTEITILSEELKGMHENYFKQCILKFIHLCRDIKTSNITNTDNFEIGKEDEFGRKLNLYNFFFNKDPNKNNGLEILDLFNFIDSFKY